MKIKRYFIFAAALGMSVSAMAEDTDISSINNVVYIESGATFSKESDGSVTIPIKMKDNMDITGYQFYLHLPNGIDANQVTLKKNPTRRSENVSFSSATQSDGTIKVVAFTSDNTAFTGDDGVIIDLSIDDVDAGSVEFTVSGIVLTYGGTTTSHEGNIVSTVSVQDIAYDAGYELKILPFSINTSNEYTETNVFLNTTTSTTAVSFNVAFSSEDFKTHSLIEAKSLISGRGTSCTITPNNDGTYSITASKNSGFEACCNVDIAKFKIYSSNEQGTYTLTQGIYNVSINNITLNDASKSYNVAPYTTTIFVGSSKATPDSEGKVSLSGDYSTTEAAALLTAALPVDADNKVPANVTAVDLSGITALPAETNITLNVQNPNTLVSTSEAIKNNVTRQVNGTATSKNVIVDGTCAELEITDGQSYAAPKNFKATSASYSRTVNTDRSWGTICLPYAVTSNSSVQYYVLKGASINGESGTLTIESVSTLPAGVPGLYKNINKSGSLSMTGAGVKVKAESKDGDVRDNFKAMGAFAPTPIAPGQYYIYNDKFYTPETDNTVTVPAFRAYFVQDVTTGSAPVRSLGIQDADDATAINAILSDNSENPTVEGYYNESGMKFTELQQGLNIVKFKNGQTKKIMVK